jgi:hypothetical protein
MKRRSRGRDGKSAVDILEEAAHRIRAAPLVLASYYIGTLPFILGLLYFWTDMSTGSDAWRHCGRAAWGMALLYLWMKTWQTVYAGRLLSGIEAQSPPRWGVMRILRAAAVQASIQPWSMLLLPIAFVILIPFPRVLAFFQNATLLGSGEDKEMGTILRRSWHQASLWPTQNVLLIWLASPFLLGFTAAVLFVLVPALSHLNPLAPAPVLLFITALTLIPVCPLGMVTALNTGMALWMAPWLLKTLFGVETVFSMSSFHLINNTFFAVVCSLSYLCLDPLLKASYCLRCYYGKSLQSGEDLKSDLRSFLRPETLAVLLLAVSFAVCPSQSVAAESRTAAMADTNRSVPVQELDSAIESVLNHPHYTWRMPREKPPEVAGQRGMLQGLLESMLDTLRKGWSHVKKWMKQAWELIQDIFSRIHPSLPKLEKPDAGWTSMRWGWMIIPLACIVIVLAFFTGRAWKIRKPRKQTAPAEINPPPDITREEVDAGLLPEDGWLNLAREWTEKGDLRLAVRALYLAMLACLARQNLITIARYKSDREYEMELRQRSHKSPFRIGAFAENRSLFESAWYGLHEVTPGIMERFSRNQEKIRTDAQE